MKTVLTLSAALGMFLSGSVIAQEPIATSLGLFVYPSGGQNAQKQTLDEQECYAWARQTTGIDPKNPPASQQPAAAKQEDTASAAARGAVGTAAKGVLLANATDNDWEQVAAAGLVIGATRGANNARRRNQQAQQQATAAQTQSSQQEVQMFKNAFSACIQGRNYTIK